MTHGLISEWLGMSVYSVRLIMSVQVVLRGFWLQKGSTCVANPLIKGYANTHFVQEFWNWFDPTAWYPLGRVVGGTVYPGLMATSGVIYNLLHAINLPVDIRNICVLLAPGFSAFTAWATYQYVL